MPAPYTKEQLFSQAPVARAVVSLALPSVAGQIILVIYNIADTFFVGLTGSDAMLAAVTVCMPAFMILSAIANLFGIGAASVISRALGDRDPRQAALAAAFSFSGCASAASAYALTVRLMLDPLVDLLGGTAPAVHDPARAYLLCTVVGAGTVTALNTLLAHLLRSEGASLQASVGVAIGGVLNLLLDPLFMFVLLPAGQEVLGAAIATSVANFLSFLYFLFLLHRRRGQTVLLLRPQRAMLHGGIPRAVLSTGLPAFIMTLFENISFSVLDKLMSLEGAAAQAGIGVAKKVNMLAHCTVRGMAQGVLPLIGYNYSSGNYPRMRAVAALSLRICLFFAGLCTGICLLFSRPLVGIFLHAGSASLAYGASFLRILCLGAPFSACAYSCISFFQATNCGKRSFLLAILRKGILDIPLMVLLRRYAPLFGAVWATPLADCTCCLIAWILFRRFLRRLPPPDANRTPSDA